MKFPSQSFKHSSVDASFDWRGQNLEESPTPQHPVQQVDYLQAMSFCNWLSEREGLSPCYRRIEDHWTLDTTANGYHMTPFLKFPYICGASTTTTFCCGNRFEDLTQYANVNGHSATPCGSKLPNAWGFFDLHGNVNEWSGDTLTLGPDGVWERANPRRILE